MKSLSNTAVTLDITKLTECTLEGSGVLDKLLHTARVHLQDEFQQGRITGKEYSNAYIAIYDRMVQSAIAYALAAEKAPYEIAQLEAQTALTEEQRKQFAALYDLRLKVSQKGKIKYLKRISTLSMLTLFRILRRRKKSWC